MGGFPVRIPLSVFWTWSCSKVVYEIIKVPVSIFRNLYIRIIVYLDNFLILRKTLEETILSRDTVELISKSCQDILSM